jgi:hypothetical protein
MARAMKKRGEGILETGIDLKREKEKPDIRPELRGCRFQAAFAKRQTI